MKSERGPAGRGRCPRTVVGRGEGGGGGLGHGVRQG